MEEFVAFGATDVVLNSAEPRDYIRSVIAPELWPRIVVEQNTIGEDVTKLLGPVAEEFNCELHGGGSGLTRTGKNLAHTPVGEILTVAGAVRELLVGKKVESYIEIDLHSVHTALARLSEVCRNPGSTARIAVLRNIFAAYGPVQTDAIIITPTATERQIQMFQEFVEDATYKGMSTAAHAFGIPGQAKRAARLFSRAARALSKKTSFRPAINLGSKIVSAATKLPVPDADFAASLFHKAYLPPVIDMRDAYSRATQRWYQVNPTAVTPSFLGHLAEGASVERISNYWGRKSSK